MWSVKEAIDKAKTGLVYTASAIAILSLAAIWTVVGPAILISGTIGQDEYFVRAMICLSLISWGFLYYLVKEKISKSVFAFLQICAAVWNNWYQIGRMAEEGTKSRLSDRWLFILVGIVVMGDGIGKLIKAEKAGDEKGGITPQSSAAPNPD